MSKLLTGSMYSYSIVNLHGTRTTTHTKTPKTNRDSDFKAWSHNPAQSSEETALIRAAWQQPPKITCRYELNGDASSRIAAASLWLRCSLFFHFSPLDLINATDCRRCCGRPRQVNLTAHSLWSCCRNGCLQCKADGEARGSDTGG